MMQLTMLCRIVYRAKAAVRAFTNWKGLPKYPILYEVSRLSLGVLLIEHYIIEERVRASKQEHVILFGKRGSGIDIVGNALLGTDNNEINKQVRPSKLANCDNGKQSSEQKQTRIARSSNISEVEGFNEQFNRNMKITYLYLDEDTSSSEKDLSSLSILHEYSVVYCFPVLCRFTAEDANILQTYFQYRQREDLTRFVIAFTYCDHLDVDIDDYIENLPAELKDLLNNCGNQYIFLSSNENSKENYQKVESLINPLPSAEYWRQIWMAFAFFAMPHFYYFLK